jgi:hypothetical protein
MQQSERRRQADSRHGVLSAEYILCLLFAVLKPQAVVVFRVFRDSIHVTFCRSVFLFFPQVFLLLSRSSFCMCERRTA